MTKIGGEMRAKIRRLFRPPYAMVGAALVVRLVVMGFVYTNQMDPSRDHWAFGWETGRVARSIATGQGFSSPYSEPTGPTALIPPVYTYLVAGVFKLFGIYTARSALVLLTLNNIFSALTCLPVFWITRRVFGEHTAMWAGWMWVFFPYSIALSNTVVWETLLTTLLLPLLVLFTLYLEDSRSIAAWTGYGLLWGVAALTSPAVLSVLPFLGAWIWLRHWRRGNDCTGVAVVASLVFFAVIAPWIWRCSQTYGHFVAFRSNFGMEVLVGNSADTSSPSNWKVLPGYDPAELGKLQRMGEPAYMSEKQREAREFIAHHTLRYMSLTLRRILNTWTGLWQFPPSWSLDEGGLAHVLLYSFISLLAFVGVAWAIHDGRETAIPLLVLPVVFPVVYYLTHSDMGFRHPIDPVIVVFMAYGAIAFRGQKFRLAARQDNLPCSGRIS
jgi:4-amino-4-deoxy-L-arabinose transferase-like glycosyltransferase